MPSIKQKIAANQLGRWRGAWKEGPSLFEFELSDLRIFGVPTAWVAIAR